MEACGTTKTKGGETMSKLGRILTMAAISMAAAQQGMTHLPDLEERPQVRRKGEAPKSRPAFILKPGPHASLQ